MKKYIYPSLLLLLLLLLLYGCQYVQPQKEKTNPVTNPVLGEKTQQEEKTDEIEKNYILKSYSALCSTKPELVGIGKYTCPGEIEFVMGPNYYMVSTEKQEVIIWTKNIPELSQRVTDCVIRDNLNWNCTYNDKSATFGFEMGEYWETPFKANLYLSNNYYPISEEVWLSHTCNGSLLCKLMIIYGPILNIIF